MLQVPQRSGKLIVFDGLDGGGKGALMDGIKKFLEKHQQDFVDIDEYEKEKNMFPTLESLGHVKILFSSEPTFCGYGKKIREEIIKTENAHKYSAIETAKYYSIDRLALYMTVLLPALQAGYTVIQSRSVSTSIVYQPIQAEPLSLDTVLSLEGNALAMKNAPDLLVVMDANAEIVMPRLEGRVKKDNARFEVKSFQEKAYDRFMSDWFRELFEKHGSSVAYLDMSRKDAKTVDDAIRAEVEDAIKLIRPYLPK